MKAFLFAALVALILFGCTRSYPPQDPCGFVENGDNQRLTWQDHMPVKLFLDPSVPVAAYPAIERAAATWNRAFGFNAIVLLNGRPPGAPERDGYNVVYWFSTWAADRPYEQAKTTIYSSGAEMVEADISINAHNFTFNMDDSLKFADVDLESVMLHELGHVLGLAHISAPGTVMYPVLSIGQVRRTLGAVDVSDLRCGY